MCPPNNPNSILQDEDNELFTLDLASICDVQFFDNMENGSSMYQSSYNSSNPLWPDAFAEQQNYNDQRATSSNRTTESNSIYPVSPGVAAHSQQISVSPVSTPTENPEKGQYGHKEEFSVEDEYCRQQKECGKAFILNQRNMMEDIMNHVGIQTSFDPSTSSSTQNGANPSVPMQLDFSEKANLKRTYKQEQPSPTHEFDDDQSSQPGSTGSNHDSESDESVGKQRRLVCKVCGDTASGFHYRVASCEACKAFFKRTVQKKIDYACPASGNCKINASGRKACQACRFEQCIKSGMLTEGVRTDRKRGGRQKYFRRAFVDQSSSLFSNQTTNLSLQDKTLLQSLKNSRLSVARGAMSVLQVDSMTPPQVWTVLAELFNRYIQDVIGGINETSGFSDLQLEVKMGMLKRSWLEVLTLKFICSGECEVLKFAPNFSIAKEKAYECGMGEYFDLCQKTAARVASLGGVQSDQLLILQAIILANSDTGSEQITVQKEIQDNLLSLLTNYTLSTSSSPSPSTSLVVVQNLLLLLPSIKEADMKMRSIWKELANQIDPNNKLLLEMICQ